MIFNILHINVMGIQLDELMLYELTIMRQNVIPIRIMHFTLYESI